jgi:hypothetical protein
VDAARDGKLSSGPEAGTPDATGDALASGGCTPDDGVPDPPCGQGEQMRCNGKCFTTPGQCQAGCELVARARNTRNVLFEHGLAYHYNASTLTVTDLATHVEKANLLGPFSSSFRVVGVRDGSVYWHFEGWLYKAPAGGDTIQWVKTPALLADSLAFAGNQLYLAGDSTLYGVPLGDAPAVTTLSTAGYDVGYDDAALYLVGALGTDTLGTYRFAGGDLTKSVFLTRELMDLGGRIYGDYLYSEDATGGQAVYRRVAKTGGATQAFLTTPMQFRSTVAAHDALYALDAEGKVKRIRSAQDIAEVARGDAAQAFAVVTDGESVYLATGLNQDGGLFRILEH